MSVLGSIFSCSLFNVDPPCGMYYIHCADNTSLPLDFALLPAGARARARLLNPAHRLPGGQDRSRKHLAARIGLAKSVPTIPAHCRNGQRA